MENIEALKIVIQKANPEILDIKFGCEIVVKDSGRKRIVLSNDWQKRIIRTMGGFPYRAEEIKIIGRPIRLADVLIAIMKKKDGIKMSDFKDISKNLAYLWNCFDDNLENQPKETKEFLTKLLVD